MTRLTPRHMLRLRLLIALLGLCSAAISGCASVSADAPYNFTELSPEAEAERALIERIQSVTLPFEGFAAVEPGSDWRIGDELLFGVEYQGAKERNTWTLGLRIESDVFSSGMQFFSGDGPAVTANFDEGGSTEILGTQITEARDKNGGDDFDVYFPKEFKFSFSTPDGKEWSFRSDSILSSVRVYDASGNEVERQVSVAPETYLRWGFQEACEVSVEYTRTGTEFDLTSLSEDQMLDYSRPFAGAIASLFAIFSVLQENKALEPILWKVIERPSVFSVLTHLGASVKVTPALTRAEIDPRALPGKPSGMTAHRFPIQFLVNDSLALRTTLSVVDPVPPLRTAAGLIAIDGVHPSHPERRVAIRLLASRRGPLR